MCLLVTSLLLLHFNANLFYITFNKFNGKCTLAVALLLCDSRFPVLSRAHQQVVVNMVERDAQVVVSGARRSNIEFYLHYLHRLWNRRLNPVDDPMLSYARG